MEVISSIIRWSNKWEFGEAAIVGKNNNANTVNKKIRNTQIWDLSPKEKHLTNVHFGALISHFIAKYIKQYCKDLKLYDFPFNGIQNIQVLRYEEGGFYVWHTDHGQSVPRTISCILLLNNDYEGGELMFMDSNGENKRKIETKPARLIMWPSNFMFPHKVNTVKKGKRYSIVAWAL